jgi:hypothetical protein
VQVAREVHDDDLTLDELCSLLVERHRQVLVRRHALRHLRHGIHRKALPFVRPLPA